ELTQAAAEELLVPVSRINLVLSDTGLVPNDGNTAGSRTSPSTVPEVRQSAAAARQVLIQLACQRWNVESGAVEVRDAKITHTATGRSLTYAELAQSDELAQAFAKTPAPDATLTRLEKWKVLGTSVPRPNRRELVTGAHLFPSDIIRPG